MNETIKIEGVDKYYAIGGTKLHALKMSVYPWRKENSWRS